MSAGGKLNGFRWCLLFIHFILSADLRLSIDLYTDKPDDALLSISSALRLLGGEQQVPSLGTRCSRLTTETMTYCLWVACHKAVTLFPYTNDEEEAEAKEERVCYALQLFVRPFPNKNMMY